MISEEEFNAFQEQLIDLGQTNFALRNQLEELKEENDTLPSLRRKYSELGNQLSEMRAKNSKTVKDLNQSIANLKAANAQKDESEAKKVNSSLNDVSAEIEKVEQLNEEKESAIFEKRAQISNLKDAIQKRRMKRDLVNKQLVKFSKLKSVLEMAPNINMFLEDMQSGIHRANSVLKERTEVLQTLNQEISQCHQQNEKLEKEVSEKEIERSIQIEEISKVNQKIREMKEINCSYGKEIEEIQSRLVDLQKQKEMVIEERGNKVLKLKEEIGSIKTEIEKQNNDKESIKISFDLSNEMVAKEKNRDLCTIQKLRKELNALIETGDSPGIPKIERDLISQIEQIEEEEKQLKDKIQMLSQAIKLIRLDLQEKDAQILKHILIIEPNQHLLSSSEFQIHETILEELILQNKELMDKYNSFNNTLSSLR